MRCEIHTIKDMSSPNAWALIRKRTRVFPLVTCALLIAFAAASVAAQTPAPLPKPTGYVNDYATVIDAGTKSKLETILTNLKQRADIEIAVVTVPSTNGEDIFDYSLAIARGWGIGSKGGDKAGLLLLVAVNDRKYFTQVSDHLEGDLPDGLAGQIQRERLVPQFKRGNYSQGIYDTVQAYVATLATKRGFSIDGIDKSYAYNSEAEQPARARRGQSPFPGCALMVIIVVVLLVFAKRGGKGGGCLNMLLLGSLFPSVNRGGRSSGWGGGGFGGFSGGGGFGGGGGGGFGGFGGGGSFGGGGAGGGW